VERRPRGSAPRTALAGIDLEAGPGELVLVLGRPGAGKTTLLEALAGLLPLQEGDVTLSGGDRGSCRWGGGVSAPGGVRDYVGLLFQFPERQFVGRTAREDLLWGDPARGGGTHAAAALERAGLPERLLDLPLARLSRGEKRRVALAEVLARRPRVLLLDEPAVGLDPEGQALVWEEVAAYRRRGGAVVLATHWPDSALPQADRVLCLEEGRPLFRGAPAALLEAAWATPALRGLLPFAWRLRIALESGADLPAGLAACRDAALLALAEIAPGVGSDQRSSATRSRDS